MAGLICDCCKLPVVPFGGEAMCECPCDLCRGDQVCGGCREIRDCCTCDPYGDDRDDEEGGSW